MGAVIVSLSYKCNSQQPLEPNYFPSLRDRASLFIPLPWQKARTKNSKQTIYFLRINIFSSFEINTNQFERWGNLWEEGKWGEVSSEVLSPELCTMLSVTLLTWTYQEKESHRDPDPRQTQHAALVVLKRICHQQSGFYVKRENKHLSSKVAEAQMKV